MPDLVSLLRDGATNLWLFIPTAVLLGALHGLEPGHSKTMMAAFIIAVRGTVGQAILLGLAATISHTLIVWLVALLGLHFGSAYATEAVEPWLQLISGVIIIAIALWMMRQTFAEQHHHHDHEHHDHDHDHDHAHVHHHDHSKTQQAGLQLGSLDYEDAHARAHRLEIEKRFAGRKVTTGQIVMFGLTGSDSLPCIGHGLACLLAVEADYNRRFAGFVLQHRTCGDHGCCRRGCRFRHGSSTKVLGRVW